MFWFHVLAGGLVALFPCVSAAPHTHDHDHSVQRNLPAAWYHPDNHPSYALFRRDASATDGVTYPEVGTTTWAAAYPQTSPDPNNLPKAWTDALHAAVSAGSIPAIPASTNPPDGSNPVYPTGVDPNGSEVCSATYKCRNSGDIWDAPDGVFGTGFDDGPDLPSPALYNFLQENNVHATHFMIGSNIMWYPQIFLQAFGNGDDIAVHTWTHPHMTTLTNEQIVGELGWTMEIIHNSTGGRLPRYWRPPYGDSDNRVRAIAEEVFGLKTIVWNRDTEDWTLTNPNGTTPAQIHNSMQQWLSGPKSPGLIILEHELSNQSVSAFIDAFPMIKANGWNMIPPTQFDSQAKPWQNSDSNTGSVTPAPLAVLVESTSTSAAAGTSTAAGGPITVSTTVSASSTGTPVPQRNQNEKSGASSLVGSPRSAVPAAILLLGAVALL